MKVRSSIYILFISISLLSVLFTIPRDAFCSSLVYSENFDDQKVDSPPFGSMKIQVAGVTAVYETDYVWDVGRGGTGYSFSGTQDKAALIIWDLYRNWPSDEIYISFWFRYSNFTNTDPHENIKLFYPHYGASGYTTATMSTPDWNQATIRSDSGTYLESSPNYIPLYFPGQTNGQWHRFEYWIKFSTAQIKYWYDGVLKADRNYPDTTDGVATWSGYVKYLTLGSIDAEEPGKFMRQFDDWEVWDGMPSSRSLSGPMPSAPSALKID